MATISSDVRPDSIESRASIEASTSWQTLLTCDNYSVPTDGFTQDTEIAPGYCEISGRVLVANKTANAQTISLRIAAADGSFITLVSSYEVAGNDTEALPLSGLYLLNRSGTNNGQGDRLQVNAGANNALEVTASYVTGIAEEA